MKTKTILLTAFIFVSIIQLAVPAKMIYNYENILKFGKEYRFKIAPIDPSDPFRGKYITLRIKERQFYFHDRSDLKNNEVIYVILDSVSPDGFARIKNISIEKPPLNVDFIKAKVDYFSNKEILYITYPFERYYLEESKAPKAERMYFDASRDTNKISYVTVKVIDGNSVLNDLIINDKSIKDLK